MATKKDLVEAYSFSRRRLVTAFVSGAPGGREVEPARPGRTIVGGIALAVLLIAGAAVTGVFSPRPDIDWNEPGLVVSKEEGTLYVVVDIGDGDPQLRPVINITSAKLILGEQAAPTVVPQDEIDGEPLGADIGILGAPADVPDTDKLLGTGWTACTGAGLGLQVRVASTPEISDDTGAGFVVRTKRRAYLVAEAALETGTVPRTYSYALPGDPGVMDAVLRELDVPILDQAVRVPEDWLELFPAGGPLSFDSFGLDGFGKPFPGAGSDGVPQEALIGDYYTDGEDILVLTGDGPAVLSPFAAAVYLNLQPPRGQRPHRLRPDRVPTLSSATPPYLDAHWPDDTLRTETGEHCAILETEAGELPAVHLASDPGPDASAAELEQGKSIDVESGIGAFVLSGGWDDPDSGEPFLVDTRGIAYPLVGADAVANLGYAGYDAPVVPDSWVSLFHDGRALSVDAALCPPAEQPRGPTCR